MPTVDCGQPSAANLVAAGASVPVIIRPLVTADELKASALLDTGSDLAIVDESLIANWGLVPVDRRFTRGFGGQQLTDVYTVQIEIPSLSMLSFIYILSADLGGLDVLLGRDQLRECTLVYEGKTGTVRLSR